MGYFWFLGFFNLLFFIFAEAGIVILEGRQFFGFILLFDRLGLLVYFYASGSPNDNFSPELSESREVISIVLYEIYFVAKCFLYFFGHFGLVSIVTVVLQGYHNGSVIVVFFFLAKAINLIDDRGKCDGFGGSVSMLDDRPVTAIVAIYFHTPDPI